MSQGPIIQSGPLVLSFRFSLSDLGEVSLDTPTHTPAPPHFSPFSSDCGEGQLKRCVWKCFLICKQYYYLRDDTVRLDQKMVSREGAVAGTGSGLLVEN